MSQLLLRISPPQIPTTAPATTAANGNLAASAKTGAASSTDVAMPKEIGRRAMYHIVTTPASKAPAVMPLDTAPQPEGPPSRRSASTGPSTSNTANAMFETALPIRVAQAQPRATTSRHPVTRSARKCWCPACVRPVGAIASRNAALPANEAASSTNAQPGPTAATMMPDNAGPTTAAPPELIDNSELACCSLLGCTISATRLVDAGPSNAVPIETIALATASSQITAWPVSSKAAIATSTASRAMSAASIRFRRASRSAHTPATW